MRANGNGVVFGLIAPVFLLACASQKRDAPAPQGSGALGSSGVESSVSTATPDALPDPDDVCIVGTLSLLIGDPAPGGDGRPRHRYFVADSLGTSTELSLADPQIEGAGGAGVLVDRAVKVEGSRPNSSSRITVGSIEAFDAGRDPGCDA